MICENCGHEHAEDESEHCYGCNTDKCSQCDCECVGKPNYNPAIADFDKDYCES